MREKQETISLLSRNELYNLSILGFIKENPIKKIIHYGSSVLVQGAEGDKWIYLYSENKNEFNKLIISISESDKFFGALDDWMIPVLTKDKEIDWLINAYQYYYPDEIEFSKNTIKTRRLTTKDSEHIISQSIYKGMLSVEYLNQRIENSMSAGIYDNEKLVAWALTHDDSSLGSLHVLEGYRGKGLAKEISISLIKQCRAINKIPFLQCEDKNIPAQKLVEGIGFVKDRNVSWMKLK